MDRLVAPASPPLCGDCLMWVASLGWHSREAFASGAIDRGLSEVEYRRVVLAEVHASHSAGLVAGDCGGVPA